MDFLMLYRRQVSSHPRKFEVLPELMGGKRPTGPGTAGVIGCLYRLDPCIQLVSEFYPARVPTQSEEVLEP